MGRGRGPEHEKLAAGGTHLIDMFVIQNHV